MKKKFDDISKNYGEFWCVTLSGASKTGTKWLKISLAPILSLFINQYLNIATFCLSLTPDDPTKTYLDSQIRLIQGALFLSLTRASKGKSSLPKMVVYLLSKISHVFIHSNINGKKWLCWCSQIFWEEEFQKHWEELVCVLTEMLSVEKNKWFQKKNWHGVPLYLILFIF